MSKRINVRSFDFDGCIFNNDYLLPNDGDSDKLLIEDNESFITKITNEILATNYHKVIFMVGSSRQSACIDDINSIYTGSCFSALMTLSEEFKKRVKQHAVQSDNHYARSFFKAFNKPRCLVDGYLLADTYGGVLPGENFLHSIHHDTNYHYSHWLFDESKVTILYAQMHKIASEHPNKKIDFDFYDDRYLENDILDGLARFFSEHQLLIPYNLRLRLHYYAGKEIKKVADIQGNGEIDYNYQNNIHLMTQCAGLSLTYDYNSENNVREMLIAHNGIHMFKNKRNFKDIHDQSSMRHHEYIRQSLFYKKPQALTEQPAILAVNHA